MPVADRARKASRRVLRTAGLHPRMLVHWWLILAVTEPALPTHCCRSAKIHERQLCTGSGRSRLGLWSATNATQKRHSTTAWAEILRGALLNSSGPGQCYRGGFDRAISVLPFFPGAGASARTVVMRLLRSGKGDLDRHTPRSLDRQLMTRLRSMQWVRERLNLLITGPTGIGKSWFASYTTLTRLISKENPCANAKPN